MCETYSISTILSIFLTNEHNVDFKVTLKCILYPFLEICIMNIISISIRVIMLMGYIFGNTLSPKNWMQFADDTAVITALRWFYTKKVKIFKFSKTLFLGTFNYIENDGIVYFLQKSRKSS